MWIEDILFIGPETQCVDLNITLDFNLPSDINAISGYENLTITNRAGLLGLSRISPGLTRHRTVKQI
jgi:hypothetical protein